MISVVEVMKFVMVLRNSIGKLMIVSRVVVSMGDVSCFRFLVSLSSDRVLV